MYDLCLFNVKAEQYERRKTCLINAIEPPLPLTLSIPLFPFPQVLTLYFVKTFELVVVLHSAARYIFLKCQSVPRIF